VSTIPLDKDDLQKLSQQNWDEDPDLRGHKTVVREHLLSGRPVLAKRSDGSCIFLSGEGRCLIHERFGAEAKPGVCRMFPLQAVPLGEFAYVTSRRSCPSAAAEQGRPVSEHLKAVKKSGLIDRFAPPSTLPPAIDKGVRRGWREFLTAADALASLLTDPQLPIVRRIVHGLRFCELLADCKLRRIKDEDWPELMKMLEKMAPEDAGKAFRDRQPPSRGAAILFRQLAVHYLRAHPGFKTAGGWRERWRMVRAMSRFARGKGQVPILPMDFHAATFADLERPLGPLSEEVATPLVRFIETHIISKQYAVVVPRQSLIESFRALAVTYAMGLWLLRLTIGDREPTVEDMIDVVVTLERGQGLTALKRAATAMATTEQLEPLVAWYAR
jgi:Fe-S-cluster containining protein